MKKLLLLSTTNDRIAALKKETNMNYLKVFALLLIIYTASNLAMEPLSLWTAQGENKLIRQNKIPPRQADPAIDDGSDYYHIDSQHQYEPPSVAGSLNPEQTNRSLWDQARRKMDAIIFPNRSEERLLGMQNNTQAGLAEWNSTERLYAHVEKQFRSGRSLSPISLKRWLHRSNAASTQTNRLVARWEAIKNGTNSTDAQKILRDTTALLTQNHPILGPELLQTLNDLHTNISEHLLQEIQTCQKPLALNRN